MKIIYTGKGKIDRQGDLRIFGAEHLKAFVSDYKTASVGITIHLLEDDVSDRQVNYYYGVIVPSIQQGLIDLGSFVSREEADYEIRRYFCTTHETIKGAWRTRVKELHEIGKEEMTLLLDQIIAWAAEYMNIRIPYPNEILKP